MVDNETPGTYVIIYDVMNREGNAATQVTRTVTVTSTDVSLPVITLTGDPVVYLELKRHLYGAGRHRPGRLRPVPARGDGGQQRGGHVKLRRVHRDLQRHRQLEQRGGERNRLTMPHWFLSSYGSIARCRVSLRW